MFEIKIDTKLNVDVGGAMRAMKIKNQNVIREIVDNVIMIAKRESPVASGVFRDSIKRLDERGTISEDGSSDKFIRIGPSIYYSKMVINKTRPSAGRYVRQLDIRIRSGFHPGTKANPVMVRTKVRAKGIIRGILNKHYGNIELTRFIR